MKLVVLGDVHVGKSNLVIEHEHLFDYNYIATNGVDLKERRFNLGGESIPVQIYDCSGQEALKHITCKYLSNVDSVMIVFDITDMTSFHSVRNWYQLAHEKCPTAHISIVGNKKDLNPHRTVTFKTAQCLANELGVPYYECSAMTRNNVNEMLSEIVRDGTEKQKTVRSKKDAFTAVRDIFRFIKVSSD
jgi:small GTP-binding protein